jgi:hypothetical protein
MTAPAELRVETIVSTLREEVKEDLIVLVSQIFLAYLEHQLT